MIAYDDYRTGFLPFVRRVRAAHTPRPLAMTERQPLPTMPELAELPTTVMSGPTISTGTDGRLLRRLRHVVRRRVRVDLAGLVGATLSDGELTLRIDTLSARDPRIVAWSADRLVALVVLHDGCGSRVIGGGGLMGRLELPSVTGSDAFLAFCYDAEAAAALS